MDYQGNLIFFNYISSKELFIIKAQLDILNIIYYKELLIC